MTLHDDDRYAAALPEPVVFTTAQGEPPPRTILSVPSVDARVAVLAQDIRLSGRERVVLRYIAMGYRYREIGLAMEISPRTVKMHAFNLRKKVGGRSRWDLMRRVLDA